MNLKHNFLKKNKKTEKKQEEKQEMENKTEGEYPILQRALFVHTPSFVKLRSRSLHVLLHNI